MSKSNWQVPFNEDGTPWYWNTLKGIPHHYEDPFEFDAVMNIDTFKRGNSSTKMILRDENNVYYEVFVSDMKEIIINMEHGIISGRFKYVKKGQDYGIKLV